MKRSLLTKVFVLLLIATIECCILEGISRVFILYTQAGQAILSQAGVDYSKTLELPNISDNELRISDHITARLRSDIDSGSSTELNPLPTTPVVILAGGSAPYGHEVKYPDTFFGIVDYKYADKLTFLNTAYPMTQVQLVGAQVRTAIEKMNVRAALIYSGDNEWNGFTYPRLSKDSFLLRLDEIFLKSDFYKILTHIVHRYLFDLQSYKNSRPNDEQFWFGLSDYCLQHPFRETESIPASFIDQFRERLVIAFDNHIEMMIKLAKEKGAKVVLVTTPIRYRLSPCWSLPQYISPKLAGQPGEIEMEKLLRQGYQALSNKDYKLAISILMKAKELDAEAVILNYFLGYAYEGIDDIVSARNYFKLSRRMMIGPGGAIDLFNESIRSKARDGVTIVDLEKGLDQMADRNLLGLGDDYFLDWCHPSVAGHKAIAEILDPTIKSLVSNVSK